jgi:hypothetical protein
MAGDREAIIVSRVHGALEGYALEGMAPLFSAAGPEDLAVEYRAIYPTLSDHDQFIGVAHFYEERVFDMTTLSLRELTDNPCMGANWLRRRGGALGESFPRLAVGPCEPADCVIYVNGEVPGEGAKPDSFMPDLEGFTIWSIDGARAVYERIPCALPIESGALLLGTRSVIAAELPDRIEIIPRAPGALRAAVSGQALAFDVEGARVVAVTGAGSADLIELPR